MDGIGFDQNRSSVADTELLRKDGEVVTGNQPRGMCERGANGRRWGRQQADR